MTGVASGIGVESGQSIGGWFAVGQGRLELNGPHLEERERTVRRLERSEHLLHEIGCHGHQGDVQPPLALRRCEPERREVEEWGVVEEPVSPSPWESRSR